MRRRVAIVAHRTVETNACLAEAWTQLGLEVAVVAPADALGWLRPGDTAVIRLDVRRTLDGCEGGLEVVPDLRLLGVRILNAPASILAAHDKLWAEQRFAEAGLPRPRVTHVLNADAEVAFEPPYVVKPRFGSWGDDVVLCESERELRECLAAIRSRPWFRSHGALVQQLVTRADRDLRILVAGGRAIGAASRIAAPGEWRTNLAQGGSLVHAEADAAQCGLAVTAVAAVGGDLMATDILHAPEGDVVLEVNGAADFDERYAGEGRDIYADAATALGLVPVEAVAA